MNEEVKRILKMVESGKITAEEGEKLIASLNQEDEVIVQNRQATNKKFIRIEVYSTEDADDEDVKVKLNIPLNLARTMLNMNLIKNQISINANDINIDFDELIALIENNAEGELLNIESKTARVRIWIE